jgi:hypothetical protein
MRGLEVAALVDLRVALIFEVGLHRLGIVDHRQLKKNVLALSSL